MSQAAAEPPEPVHPLWFAGRSLLIDMGSTLAFVGLYAATESLSLSIGAAVALGVGQIAWQKRRGAAVDPLQWASLFLVVVFGGATLITQNRLFIMCKPTLIYCAIGIVMLQRGWMLRFIPPIRLAHATSVTIAFGYVWAALMFATAGLNLVLVLTASPAIWAWFVAVFPIGSKALLVAVQYVVTRQVVRRRIRAATFVTTGSVGSPGP
jgi:intracellular septation protein A